MANTVKEHILQRSKQVKTGIKAANGPKSFTAFGMKELAAFVNVQAVNLFDLTELKSLSVALNGAALHSHQQGYHAHRQGTMKMENGAKKMISEMVNPVDEDEQ